MMVKFSWFALLLTVGFSQLIAQSSSWLTTELAELEDRIELYQLQDTSVSQAEVGWHLAHSLLVIEGVSRTLMASDPADYQGGWNIQWGYVSMTGNIPRGRAQAPASTRPEDPITPESLQALLSNTQQTLTGLNELEPNAFFDHPLFGNLNMRKVRRFMKIVADIVQEVGQGKMTSGIAPSP